MEFLAVAKATPNDDDVLTVVEEFALGSNAAPQSQKVLTLRFAFLLRHLSIRKLELLYQQDVVICRSHLI